MNQIRKIPKKFKMSGKNIKKSIHDQLVSKLEEKLQGTHDSLQVFWKYNMHGYCGEVDILGKTGSLYTFYEVKCHLTKKSMKTAHEQYERFKAAFPKLNAPGYFYSGKELIRL